MLRKMFILLLLVLLVSLVGTMIVTANEDFLGKIKNAGYKSDGTPLKVGVCAAGLTAEFAQVLNGYTDWLLRKAGCEVDFVDVAWDLNKQISFFEDFATMGKEVIICQGVDIYALADAIRKSQSKGITVIATNNPMLDKNDNLVSDFYVGSPNIEMAQRAAEFLGEKSEGKKVKIVQIMGNLANLNARERDEYFRKTLEKYSNVELVDSQAADWISDKAYHFLIDMFTATPDIWGIYVQGDGMLPGVWSALKQIGKLHPVGDKDHIIIASINGDPVGLKGIRDGFQDLVIEQSGYEMAIVAAKAALMIAKDLDLPEYPKNYIETKAVNITIENVDDPALWGNFGVPHDILWPQTQEIFESYKWPGDERIFE